MTRVRYTGAPTLGDVAREAGVSLATASRVLNGSARRVAESYAEPVRAAADRLGYAPNLSAQATARGTTSVVALLVRDIADPYFSGLAAGVARGAHQAGLTVTIAATGRDPDGETKTLRALRGQRPRAVILASSRSDDASQEPIRHELGQISSRGGQIVALGGGLDGFRAVSLNHHDAARELGDQLIARGYSNAVVLGGPAHLRTVQDRQAGFISGFTSGGGHILATIPTELTRETAASALTPELVGGLPSGTLIFGVTDVVAIGALSAIREAGRPVGKDLGLAGFGDIPISRDVTPSLTTVGMPLEHIGYLALQAAIDDEWDATSSPVPMTVLLRDSTPRKRARE